MFTGDVFFAFAVRTNITAGSASVFASDFHPDEE